MSKTRPLHAVWRNLFRRVNAMTSQSVCFEAKRSTRAVFSFVPVLALALFIVLGLTLAATARGAPESFADLAERVSPAVVNITTTTTVATPTERLPIFPEGSPFGDLFRDFGAPQDPGRPRRSNALGSGFVISEDGFIVTNNHVIDGADSIEIEFFSGERLAAKVVGADPNTDVALLKVESSKPLSFVIFGNSDVMRVGDWVMAMGNPLGQGFSVSAGIISARNRELSGTYDDYLQTDAAINRGNSGGPLFNMTGEVVGVNTAILSPNGGSIGIGFSMASNVVVKVVNQLKEFGETRRGWLGVKIQDVTPDMAEALGLTSTTGTMVTDVPAGPAADAGVKMGDVIVQFDGAEVKDTRDLVRRVADAPVGQAVRVVVIREGKRETLLVTLGQRELAESEPVSGAPTPDQNLQMETLGMVLVPLTPEAATEAGLPASSKGLLIDSIEEGGVAWEKGLRAGDVVMEVGQRPVATLAEFQAQVEEAKAAGRKSVLLLVRRAGEPRFLALPVE
jgi:serine protease Do